MELSSLRLDSVELMEHLLRSRESLISSVRMVSRLCWILRLQTYTRLDWIELLLSVTLVCPPLLQLWSHADFIFLGSPTLELTPTIPLRHGHAICIDMAYSTTLSYTRGNITATERDEILGLMSRVGLSLDHPLFDEALLVKGTAAILQTRDGSQRFVL